MAFVWFKPVGIALGEAARLAFVVGECIWDVEDLRNGYTVPLIKNSSQWIRKPSTMFSRDSVFPIREYNGKYSRYKDGLHLSYSYYMIFFFITQAVSTVGGFNAAGNILVQRTTNLIEWNMVNYIERVNGEKINADSSRMATALAHPNRFRMKKMKTDFQIDSAVQMRMLFLSLPMFLQRGSPFTNEFLITVTDRRGY